MSDKYFSISKKTINYDKCVIKQALYFFTDFYISVKRLDRMS